MSDITKEILKELEEKHELYGAGWKSFEPFVIQALTRQREEIVKSLRMEKKKEIDHRFGSHYEDCWVKTGVSQRNECICGLRKRDDMFYNQAVDEFNKKLDKLK